jgi:hypothetical protein
MGIAATRFCHPGEILQIFIDKISKFYGCRRQHRMIRIASSWFIPFGSSSASSISVKDRVGEFDDHQDLLPVEIRANTSSQISGT